MIRANTNYDGSVVLTAQQGTAWTLGLTFYRDAARTTPLVLTGKALRGQYRQSFSSEKLFDFTVTVDAVHQVNNPDENRATLTLAPAISAAVTILSGVYDIELYDPQNILDVERIMRGTLIIDPEVTK